MGTLLDVLLVVVGSALVLAVYDSALRTFVLPRGEQPPHPAHVPEPPLGLQPARRESRTYEARDRVMALYAPVGLFGLVLVWLTLVFVGYTLIFYAVIVPTWHDAIELSGSSLLTLGFELPPRGLPGYVLVFTEAATGLAILALLIAYLPTIYGAFSRREREVSRFATLAGTPPSAVAARDAVPPDRLAGPSARALVDLRGMVRGAG